MDLKSVNRTYLSILCAFALVLSGCAAPGSSLPAVGPDRSILATIVGVHNLYETSSWAASASTTSSTGITMWNAFGFSDQSMTIVASKANGAVPFIMSLIVNPDGSAAITTTDHTYSYLPNGTTMTAIKSGADSSAYVNAFENDAVYAHPSVVKPITQVGPSSFQRHASAGRSKRVVDVAPAGEDAVACAIDVGQIAAQAQVLLKNPKNIAAWVQLIKALHDAYNDCPHYIAACGENGEPCPDGPDPFGDVECGYAGHWLPCSQVWDNPNYQRGH